MVRDYRLTGRRRLAGFDPMILEEIVHMTRGRGDPVGILMAAGLVRDEAPWLYELALDVYRALRSGDRAGIQREISGLRHLAELMMRGPFVAELAGGRREVQMLWMEFPRMLEEVLRRSVEEKRPPPRRRTPRAPAEQK